MGFNALPSATTVFVSWFHGPSAPSVITEILDRSFFNMMAGSRLDAAKNQDRAGLSVPFVQRRSKACDSKGDNYSISVLPWAYASWLCIHGSRRQNLLQGYNSQSPDHRWADMEVPSESFHRSSWDSRTCYPRRAFNQKTTDGSWTYAHLPRPLPTDGQHLQIGRLMLSFKDLLCCICQPWCRSVPISSRESSFHLSATSHSLIPWVLKER